MGNTESNKPHVITLTNHSGFKQLNRLREKGTKCMQIKEGQTSHDWFLSHFKLVQKVAQTFVAEHSKANLKQS